MIFYFNPLLIGGAFAFLGIVWGVLGGITGNMASKRGLKWQTAFLLSFVVPVPLLLAIYSGRPVEDDNPLTQTKWLSGLGRPLLIVGASGILALTIYAEYHLAVPIRALEFNPTLITVLAATTGVLAYFGAALITASRVAEWNDPSEL